MNDFTTFLTIKDTHVKAFCSFIEVKSIIKTINVFQISISSPLPIIFFAEIILGQKTDYPKTPKSEESRDLANSKSISPTLSLRRRTESKKISDSAVIRPEPSSKTETSSFSLSPRSPLATFLPFWALTGLKETACSLSASVSVREDEKKPQNFSNETTSGLQ